MLIHTLFSSQVILRTFDPSTAETPNPYSLEALARLTLTNLRIRLLKPQTCPASKNLLVEGKSTDPALIAASTENSASEPYAISTFLARGTCLCHGHAEYCVPHNSSQDTRKYSNMVSDYIYIVCHNTDVRMLSPDVNVSSLQALKCVFAPSARFIL